MMIAVSANVMVNSCNVDALEQRDIAGTVGYFVCVGEKEYLLTVPLEKFIIDMKKSEEEDEVK